jgi:hypothetical protein
MSDMCMLPHSFRKHVRHSIPTTLRKKLVPSMHSSRFDPSTCRSITHSNARIQGTDAKIPAQHVPAGLLDALGAACSTLSAALEQQQQQHPSSI